MDDYKFEKFTRRGAKLGNYSISLTKNHSFGFSSAFCSQENLKQYKKVVLYYDKDKNSVAFYFTNEEDSAGAFTLVHHKTNTAAVTCRSFCIANNIIEPKHRGPRKPRKIHYNNLVLYVVDLNLDTSNSKESENNLNSITNNTI
jgi:hypothetical protein